MLQINLHHCKAASAGIVLIQEPWIAERSIRGLMMVTDEREIISPGGNLPRACLLTKKQLAAHVGTRKERPDGSKDKPAHVRRD